VPASLSATANFAPTEVNYALRFMAGAGGVLRGPIWQTVRAGGNASAVSAVSGTGHHFVNWTDADNRVVSYSATLKFTKVTANKRLTANFK